MVLTDKIIWIYQKKNMRIYKTGAKGISPKLDKLVYGEKQ